MFQFIDPLKSSPKTSVVAVLMIAYGLGDMFFSRGITEAGGLFVLMGLGFWNSADNKKKES